jgi:hypothetical protein
MNPIKKFSTEMNQPTSILESINSKALKELIKGMGFNDIHELKKEKALLAKLEALMKEIDTKHNISEDDAKEIEDHINKKGEPKSLEDKAGEKEPELPIGDKEDEIAEEETEETDSEEETEETDSEEETEETNTNKSSRKIMTFDDFIKEDNYNRFLSEAAGDLIDEDDYDGSLEIPIIDTDGETASDIEDEINDKGEPKIKDDKEGAELVTKDQEITEDPKTAKDEPESHGTVVVKESAITEAEVTSDEEFKEYAFTVLQNAFGDDFDEAKAQEVVDGLISKYSGDYGAMVGAVKASLAESEE